MEHDSWSRSRLLTLQGVRLRALVRHAVDASPYYREAFGPSAATGEVPLDELPTLPKTTLMEQFDRIVTDPRLSLADVEAHIARAPSEPYRGEYRVFTTSGTTGVRGLVVYRPEEFERWVAATLRTVMHFGLTPTTRFVGIGAPSPLHMSNQLLAALRDGRPPAPRLAVTTAMGEIVEALNSFQPEAIGTYASIAALLADEQLAGRLRIAPTIVGCSSEVLTGEMRRRIREAWGVEAVELYASTEVPIIASSAPAQVGLHIWEDMSILEVVDEQNRPVPPGTPGDKVLLTNLVNHAQPLIRYEISDSVTLADEPSPTGMPYRRISAIDGRSEDVVQLPAPGGGEVAVHPYRLHAPFAALATVRQYQIVHNGGGLRVHVVLDPAASSEAPAELRAALARELEAAGAVPSSIEVEPVTAIEREPGHAAKLKLIKSEARGSDRVR